MTEPSLQKMQTTPESNVQKMHNTPDPESNVQKMHIPAEWVEAAFAAYDDTAVPDCGTSHHGIKAALTAVIPLIREDERERLALKLSSEESDPRRMVRVEAIWTWLRAQRRE